MAKKQSPIVDTADEAIDEPEKWIWAVDDPLHDGIAGDIAKLFKAENFDTPGVLADNAPTNEAALFAREAIQNSWDAAREWQETCQKNREKKPDFSIHFKFEEIEPRARLNKVFALGLNEHSRHVEAERAKTKRTPDLGLANTDLLTNVLANNRPLKLLTVTEHGGLGMPGRFDDGNSRMMKALLRVGQANNKEGSGGAFGFGKAGLIAASATRIVFAYSAFREVSSEPGVSRRLLGVTYWKSHERGAQALKLSGWARFGSEVVLRQIADNNVETIFRTAQPFVNEEADNMARTLGLDLRDSKNPAQTGTTFLLVDPTITASDLKVAIERYWWPAMIDQNSGLKIEITDYDGADKSPEIPVNDPNINPFIEAFRIAKNSETPKNPNHGRFSLGTHKPHKDPNDYKLGVVGLVADPDFWSFPDTNDGIDHKTIVALIRGPGMIVNYLTFSNLGIPHIRGLFVADDSIDELLRQTEDSAHTKWEEKSSTKNPSAPIIAKEVKKRLREKVIEFKEKFAPPPPPPGDNNLPVLDELSKLMKGRKVVPPKPEPRQVLVRLVEPAHRIPTRDEMLICEATVEFEIADWVWPLIKVQSAEISVSLSLSFVEDGGTGEELEIKATCSSSNFKQLSNSAEQVSFTGTLSIGETVQFKIRSEKYAPDWSVRFSPTAVITSPKVPPKKSKAK